MDDDNKKDNYYKEGFMDNQNCDTCGLQKFEIEYDGETVGIQIETKKCICLIKSKIAQLHEQILGCTEHDKSIKPNVALSTENEFFTTKRFKELKKEHKCSLKVSFDSETYEKKPLTNFKPIDDVNFSYIEKKEDLEKMVHELLKCKEIAVNLEYYTERSYLGFTWLLQISTEDTYYMINCPKLQREMHILNAVFMDIKILKIFHNGENAVLRLYQDFGIMVTNMFDTAILKKILLETRKKDLLQKNIGFNTNQMHTHFLIFLKTYLVNISKTKFLKRMRKSCKNICRKVCKKSNLNGMNFKKLLTDKATNRERFVAKELLKWRDKVAQKEDESVNFILPDSDVIKIARELLFGRKTSSFSKCYGFQFLLNEETRFDIEEVVLEAKMVSNRGKNLKWFLNKQNQLYMEAKLNLRKSKDRKKSENQDIIIVKSSQPVKKSPKTPPAPRVRTISQVQSLIEESLLKILKPQTCFKDSVDNDSPIWKPCITTKPNAIEPLDLHIEHQGSKSRYCHPYKAELENFVVPRDQLFTQIPIQFKKLEETPLHIITTEGQLQAQLKDLKKYSEIAVDLKYNKKRSYSGYTCFLLISTRDSDYIIDALLLRSELQILNDIFTDPTVLKVFHDSVKQMMWLQKDFSIYVINMFDTARTTLATNKKVQSLNYLKKRICNISNKTMNETELSEAEKDWRVRPFSKRVKNYLRLSTHHLLYIKDMLSNELFLYSNLLKRFYEYCTDLCKNVYCKPFYQANSYKKILDKKFIEMKYDGHTARIRVMKELHKLRYDIAEKEDENPKFVMSYFTLLKLVDALPVDEQKIVDLWNYDKASVYAPIVKEIICSARNLRVALKNYNDIQYIYNLENKISSENKIGSHLIILKNNKLAQEPKKYEIVKQFNSHVTLADFLCRNEAIKKGIMHIEKSNKPTAKAGKSHCKKTKNISFLVTKGKFWNESQTIRDWLKKWIDKKFVAEFESQKIADGKWKITTKCKSKNYKDILWHKRHLIYFEEGTLISRSLTAEEQKAQESLWNIGKELKTSGLQVKVRDVGIKIEDKWYEWKAEGGLQEISEEEAINKGIDVDL